MLLIMAVTFYSTRVILKVLGVDDYGVYNAIGGIVVLFGFLNTAMVTTTQRFLNYHIGKNDYEGAARYFSMSLIVHFVIGIFVVIFTEIVGLLFLYTKMSLPPTRFDAAFWTLQISILITFVNILRSPYNACIIAFERMEFYAYISIVEAFAKLSVVYLLYISLGDKLINYSVLLLVVSVIIMLCYKIFCNRNYQLSNFKYQWDRKAFKKLMSFSGFSVLGNASNVVAQQGQNMLLNIFFGVIANAAAGVSGQLSGGVYSFCSNFQVAFNPQLVKSYARGAMNEVCTLITQMSKVSYFLLLFLSLPLMIFCEDFLHMWLGEVPQYAYGFCLLTLILHLVDSISAPLWVTVQASGTIKKYQIVISTLVISNLPLSLIFLMLGYNPVVVFIVRNIINVCAYVYRYIYASKLVGLNFHQYSMQFLLPAINVTVLCLLISYLIYRLDYNYIVSSILIMAISCCLMFTIGLNKKERLSILNIVKRKVCK